ncbi:hypothetical protein AB0D08_11525 [Kitasatospora sp. NPDC048540]|uniref:hypothetical protein n=1 Tax=unclassified Kitasatospora TaxID=2633591 RepID=UPI0018F472E6|nr:hypothetical protein [Kitasatospora sp. MBT63]
MMTSEPQSCPHCGRVDLTAIMGPDFARRAARRRRAALLTLLLCCAALVPWIAYLAATLPIRYESRQWRAAWVGFDLALLATLAATAWYGWRGRQLVVPWGLAAAVLLTCDAWFDVMLAWGTGDFTVSVLSAALVELPLAGYLLARARRILQFFVRMQWYLTGMPGDPPPLHRALLLSGTTASSRR